MLAFTRLLALFLWACLWQLAHPALPPTFALDDILADLATTPIQAAHDYIPVNIVLDPMGNLDELPHPVLSQNMLDLIPNNIRPLLTSTR
jgi:hypothetical protein